MRFVPFALLFVLPTPVAAQGPVTSLTPDSEAQWVAFDLTPGNQIRFEMTLNGKPATAVLDTGVSYTVASTGFAKTAGLKLVTTSSAEAIGGAVPIGWAAVGQVSLGGLRRSGGRVAITDLKAIATGSDKGVDMLVGADILQHGALDIDYDAKRFRMLPTGRMPFRGTSVPLSLARDSGVYLSELTIGTRRLRPVIVDTGDGSAITVSGEAWTAARGHATNLTTALAYGLGGAIVTDLTVLPMLKLGPLTARQVEVRIERGAGFSTQTATAGRIGSAFLQRYRVLMDPKAGRMILSPGVGADRPPLRSTSGLLVGYEKSELRVLHVMRGSPAQGSGWRIGDRICRIDGTTIAADYIGSSLAIWTAGTPGRTVDVGMCDGSRRALTLKTFY